MFTRSLAAVAAFVLVVPVAFAAPPSSARPDRRPDRPPVPPPAWVAQSNAYAQVLLKTLAEFNPEFASQFGLPGYDDKVVDLKPNVDVRSRKALAEARDALKADLAKTTDANVREDLEIMIHAADRFIESSKLQDQYMLPYTDIGQTIFQGEFGLLQDQVAAARRPHALARLKCYVGMAPGCAPVTKEAEALFEAKAGDKKLLGPYKAEVEQNLANTKRYVDGIRKLYAKYKIEGAGPALDALQQQLDDYSAWVKSTVLPRARTDARLPEPIYADNLKNVGIDIPPQELMKQAQKSFMEIQNEMKTLAPYVARVEGFAPTTDYRTVIKDLKKQQLDRDNIESYYQTVIDKIEAIIRDQHIV
ncbi:MAG TPA: DUF885 family protein, partial [Rhodanobacteraceae bacterium]|nr:DUF885 family protein [Rhodanobacteraceae bacterium]